MSDFSDGSETLKLLFKKEQMSKERREPFALGHKKGKTVKEFVKQFARFLWPIRSNHERIPHNSLFTGTNCSQLLPNPAYLCRWIHACNIVKPADEIYIYTYLHAVDIIKPADEIFLYLNDIFG